MAFIRPNKEITSWERRAFWEIKRKCEEYDLEFRRSRERERAFWEIKRKWEGYAWNLEEVERERERHTQNSLRLSCYHARWWFFFFLLSLCWDLQLQTDGFIPYLPCLLTLMATSLVPLRFLSFLRMQMAPIRQSLSRVMSGRRKKKEEGKGWT